MTWPRPSLIGKVSAVVLVAAALTGASAASLGGISATGISAWVLPVDIDPGPTGPMACSEFSGSGPIAGQPAGCAGGVWSVSGGNWQQKKGLLKATAGASIASVPATSPFVSAQVDVVGADRRNRVGGIVISYDPATGSHLAIALVGDDTVELRAVNGGSTSVLASAVQPIQDRSTLIVSRTASNVFVSLDGVQVLSATVSQTTFTGTAAGLFFGGGPPVEFDDFVLTVP